MAEGQEDKCVQQWRTVWWIRLIQRVSRVMDLCSGSAALQT